MVLTSWGIIAILMAYSYKAEKDYRAENVYRQLDIFSTQIIKAYRQGIDLDEYMTTLSTFFDGSRYEGISVSVYRKEDIAKGNGPRYYMGSPINLEYVQQHYNPHDIVSNNGTVIDPSGNTYYFDTTKSNDGSLTIYTSMPNTEGIAESLQVADPTFWIVLVTLVIISTLMAYWLTNVITRNIKMLRQFAIDANNPNVRFDETQFPHNELGDISREIVTLYRQRGEAMSRSEREHNVALHAVEEKARIKRQMTNNINHELKTPVGVIKGYLDTVLNSTDMDRETQFYFLQRAQDNVDRLCNLLNDVSTMTRLEEGSGNIPVTPLNFHDLVYAIDNDFHTSGLLANMEFTFDIPLDCEVLGNSNLLTSAISNLMKNATVHSHGSKMGLRIVAESSKYYTFSFWDNGRGVDVEHVPHLFDRFYRVDSGRSRKTGGTGLGLPIVRNIIEALGGSISVHNRSAGGLEFMFTLKKSLKKS